MLNNNTFKNEHLLEFFECAVRRQAIYNRRLLNLPKDEWTDDPIFKEWRFCNVFRRLDKVTDYICKYVIEPNEDNPDLWKMIITSRFFSRIETIQFLINNKWFSFGVTMANHLGLRSLHQPIMTSAFILNPLTYNGKRYHKYWTPYFLIKDIKEKITDFDKWLLINTTINDLTEQFKQLPSTAGFMAYEYATDFTYSKRYFSNPPKDEMTYGNFTIGSLRGLKRLLGYNPPERAPFNKLKDDELKYLTINLLHIWNDYNLLNNTGVPLCKMREVEHWLCEYDKYMRIKLKETNRLKQRYKGN